LVLLRRVRASRVASESHLGFGLLQSTEQRKETLPPRNALSSCEKLMVISCRWTCRCFGSLTSAGGSLDSGKFGLKLEWKTEQSGGSRSPLTEWARIAAGGVGRGRTPSTRHGSISGRLFEKREASAVAQPCLIQTHLQAFCPFPHKPRRSTTPPPAQKFHPSPVSTLPGPQKGTGSARPHFST
jgi:hypothetical protein